MQINTKNRQQAILDILQAQPVFSQEELALLLKEAGIVTTQATLSRDLKALKISKVPGEGYVSRMHTHSTVATNLSSAIVRVQFSGQLGVIKTLPAWPTPLPVSSTTRSRFLSSAPLPGTTPS